MRRFPLSVWLVALALAALTSLPYLIGSWSAPPGWEYSGAAAVPIGAQVDFNSHLAKMWQGSRGQWDYRLLFTHEAHPGLPLLQGFYVALGALAHVTPFSLPAMYHLARFALTVGLVLALWAFASHFFEQSRERWLALLFGTVVSGCSWLLLALDPAMTAQLSPIEFWLTDAFNLLGALVMPHFAAAIILQIVVVLTFEGWVLTPDPLTIHGEGGNAGTRYIVSLQTRSLGILTLALAAQAVVQPYAALLFGPLLVILAGYHVFTTRRLRFRRALWLILPLGIYAALVGYQAVALNSHPVWSSFAAQNQTLSPVVTYYLLGYLPFILPMAVGLRVFLLDKSDDRWWLPILWVALVAMLLYAPFPTQRRYLLGVQTPLAVLAAYGWSRGILPRLSARLRPLVTMAYLGLAAVAIVGVIAVNAVALSEPYTHTHVFYKPDELEAFAWLRAAAGHDALVLTVADEAGRGSGGRLVAALGQRVYLGHWIETVDFTDKVANVRRFYDPATPDVWRKTLLKDIGAAYVWYDEYARAAGDWNPADADYLESVFISDMVMIFRVTDL